MKVSELAQKLGYHASGRLNDEITGVAYAVSARPMDVALIFNRKEAENTASTILAMTVPGIIGDSRTIIYTVDEMELACLRIARLLIEEGVCPDYSTPSPVHPINKGYSIGQNVHIGANTTICSGAVIHDHADIGSNCRIGPNTIVNGGVTIGNNVTIGCNSCIGGDAFYRCDNFGKGLFCGIGGVRIGDSVSIGNQVTVQRGAFSDTIIGKGTRLGNLIDVAHDVKIGENCFIVSQTGFASDVTIGDNVTLYGQVGVSNNVTISNGARVYAKSLVTKDIGEKQRVSGYYAFNHKDDLRLLAKLRCQITNPEN